MTENTNKEIIRVARQSYGRLLAYLSSASNDVLAAEDPLSDAFVSAIEKWPHEGLPKNPEAWLLSVTKRRWIDGIRKERTATRSSDSLQIHMESAMHEIQSAKPFQDQRLNLMFACAHPAIEPLSPS